MSYPPQGNKADVSGVATAAALAVANANIDTLIARLTAARAGYLENINNATLQTLATMRGTDGASLASVYTAARAGYMDAINRDRPDMIFPSASQAIVVIPGTGADLNFPNVTIAGLPDGLSIKRADLVLVIGGLFETSGSENQIKTDTSDQLFVKKAADAWADGSPEVIPALTFTPLGLQVAGDAYRGGPVIFGAIDIKGVITANGVYNFRSDETVATKGVEATAGTIELLDVSIVIRVWFN